MTDKRDVYEMTEEVALQLSAVRSSLAMLADLASKLHGPTSDDLKREVQFLDKFMDDIGATGLAARAKKRREEYRIDTSKVDGPQ